MGAINAEGLERCGIEHAELLIRFADAVAGRETEHLAQVRAKLLSELGEAALVDAAAVCAVFNAVVRIADATGIPLEAYKEEISVDMRKDLRIDDYHVT